MYTQTNNVNIKPKSYLPEFHVSQNDVGRTLTAHLVSDDGDVTIPAGATVTMAGTKPSGLGYTVTGTIDGSDVSFDTDAVMTDEPGRIVSEIRIVQGDTLIGTTNVVLSVEPNPHPDDTTDGRREPLVNEITALLESITEQADRVEEYSGKVLGMTVTAHESDEATVTKTEGEVVNLDFGLPRGPQGIQGVPGQDGQDGVTPDFSIGTVETLAPDEQATATITGTDEDPVLNLGIPQGAKGDKGDPGEVSLETLAKVMVSDTASGTIASFTDGSDALPAKSVLVTLAPKQDLHGYDKPWVGGAGVNKFDPSATINLRDYSRNGEVFTNTNTDTRATCVFNVMYYGNGTLLSVSNSTYITATGRHSLVLNLPSGTDTLRIRDSGSTRDLLFDYPFSGVGYYTISADFTSIDPTTVGGLVIKNIQLESGQSATSWTPYENICPVSGWDEVETNVAGVNLLDDSKKQMSGNQIAIGYSGVNPWTNGVSAHLKAGTYTLSVETADGTNPAGLYVGYSGEVGHKFVGYSNKVTFTLTEEKDIYVWVYKTGYADIGVDAITHAQLELGSTATAYEPYDGHTYTTDLPQTVYGGTLDVVSGVLTVTHGYISPYNGETINEPWISDRDEYVAGTTPTTGAQVVYLLATPTTIQCDPQTVQTLIGDNNVWGGDETAIEYYADTKLYIEKMLGA